MGAGLSFPARAQWGKADRFRVVAAEPWGRLEQVGDGIWAMVSTPLTGSRTTLCNGGIVAGRDGVLMVEAFASDAGATWMAEQARALTGRAPTHVVVTHYHSDHTGGLRAACASGAPSRATLHATATTRELTTARNQGAATDLLADAVLVDPAAGSTLDLGGRRITLAPHDGHTPSDVSVRVEDSSVLFCGDLMWNGMFPNFVDALPSRLTRSVRALRASGATTFVPGHGTVATVPEMDRYLALLDSVEAASRRAVERGITAEAAGAEYKVPAELGEWLLFNPRYFERAIGAWMKELRPGG
jgi:glyoxylase-like metal-dependent hydrolase (beta-lactamase superfamily II)